MQTLKAVPLTSYEGSETGPTLSPDGSQVAFSWNGESRENFDIYTQVIGAGSRLRLTEDPADDLAPAWSPDGRYLAFLRSTDASAGGRAALYVISPLGGAERKLAEGNFLAFRAYYPVRIGWSSDARTVFVAEVEGKAQGIHSVDVENGEKRRLTSPPPWGDYAPAISPDGKSMAFGRAAVMGDSAIYIAQTDGAGLRRLTSVPGSASVAWMPGGREVIFASRRTGATASLWRIAAAGGEPKRLAIVGEAGAMPAISPNGGRLVYERSLAEVNIWRYDRPAPGGDAWPPRKLIASTRVDAAAQISPDGNRIAFCSLRSGGTQIWLADSDGSNPRQLTSLPLAGSPRWSPDSRSIAFDSTVKGSMDIFVIDSQGGPPRPVIVEKGGQARPSWSHDGKWIYYDADQTGSNQVWKVPAG